MRNIINIVNSKKLCKKVLLYTVSINLFLFSNVGFSIDDKEQDYDLYMDIIFNDEESDLTYEDKSQIMRFMPLGIGKDSKTIIDKGRIYYYDYDIKQKDLLSFRVQEVVLKNMSSNAIVITEGCPTYLCGTVGSYLYVFYRINGVYEKVFSNNTSGVAIEDESKSTYPNLLFMGRGFRCARWVWNEAKLKYEFNTVIYGKSCEKYNWNWKWN